MNNKEIYTREFLKDNPVFWSRLGFCYDPPLKNEFGKPLVFTENLDKYAKYHRDFAKNGVKIHTSILHSGWVGVDEYDYSLTDRVLDAVFKDNGDIYYIPRIKLNVPVDWCRENPEEVFVYDEDLTDKEEIRALVGTLRQDYLGYDAPNGYYQAGDYVDTRPNVNSRIARQSFSSVKWLEDAGVALKRLIDRLESSKYADRIIGYHIAFGTSGESVLWGRISEHYGDYGITNKKEFYNWGIKKYKSVEELEKAWCQKGITETNIKIPSQEKRAGKTNDFTDFFRGNEDDVIAIDYESFTSEVTANAVCYFAKIAKATGKLVGAFYGYFIHVDNAAYAGHLAIDTLLNSPYIDVFAAPKSYYRCGPGEPGGELCPAQSINLKKLWLDELDIRTHLADDEVREWVSGNKNETVSVFWREFSKNLAHNSGFWWMDLGGGWYDSPELMSEVASMVRANDILRKKPHKSMSDVLIIVDENSAKYMRQNTDIRCGFMEDFIFETQMSGALSDVYRLSDLDDLDLSQYKLVVFAYTTYLEKELFERIKNKLSKDTTILFNYAAGTWNKNGFDLKNAENITGYKIAETKENPKGYDFPQIMGEKTENTPNCHLLNTVPYLKHNQIRKIAKEAGCHIYTKANNVTIYGDNRVIGVFNKEAICTELCLKEKGTYLEFITNTLYENTDKIPLDMGDKDCRVFIAVDNGK